MTRVCVITGAASGIGLATAQLLSDNGWTVVGVDLNGDLLQREAEGTFEPLAGNVADVATHEHALTLGRSKGELKGWVNNAGYDILGRIHEIPVDEYRRGIDVVLDGTFFGTATAVREMLGNGGGSIVNVSSVHGIIGVEGGGAAYAAAKGGVIALSRQVACEYADEGIRCNAIAPGIIDTPINADIFGPDVDPRVTEQAVNSATPMKRAGQPEEVARAIEFLLDPEASGFITGHTLAVDGGMVTSNWQ